MQLRNATVLFCRLQVQSRDELLKLEIRGMNLIVSQCADRVEPLIVSEEKKDIRFLAHGFDVYKTAEAI